MKLIPLLKEIKIVPPHKVKLRIPNYEPPPDEDYFYSGILTEINIPVWVEMWDTDVHGGIVVIYITQFYDDDLMSSFNLHKDKESAEKDALKLKLYAKKYKYEIAEEDGEGGVTVKIPLENIIIVNE